MTLPIDVQRALSKRCGDRYIENGNYDAILVDLTSNSRPIAESLRAIPQERP